MVSIKELFHKDYVDESKEKFLIFGVPYAPTLTFKEGAHFTPIYLPYLLEAIDYYHYYCPHIKPPNAKYILLTEILPHHYEIRTIIETKRAKWSFSLENDSISYLNETIEKALDAQFSLFRKYLLLENKKKAGMIGGEHTCSYPFIRAISELNDKKISVLVIDAHCDLRPSYENINFSHACTIQKISTIKDVENIIIVGARDFSHDDYSQKKNAVITSLTIAQALTSGQAIHIIDEIISKLGDYVYISVDVDGLEPQYAPSTGTPVLGGIPFAFFATLLKNLFQNKKIIGFDICEASPKNLKNLKEDINILYCGQILEMLLPLLE